MFRRSFSVMPLGRQHLLRDSGGEGLLTVWNKGLPRSPL
jgi:hypothetical protein